MKAEPPQRNAKSTSRNWILVLAALFAPFAPSFAYAADSRPIPSTPAFLVGDVAAILLLIVLDAAFEAAGTALAHARATMLKNGERTTIGPLLENRERSIASCRLATFVTRTLLVILTLLPSQPLADVISALRGTSGPSAPDFVMAMVICTIPVITAVVLVSEIFARSLATVQPVETLKRLRPIVPAANAIYGWQTKLILRLGEALTTKFGGEAKLGHAAEEQIKTLLDTAQESGEIQEDERDLLQSVFDFGDTVAREIMTPRVDLDAMPIDSDPQQIIELIRNSGRSRIPLFEGTDDQIIGVIHAKDLLLNKLGTDSKPINLRTMLRPPLFVPENKKLTTLLHDMRASRTEMAIIQDEFGGTAGIVTVEDIVEELVGDIVDEYDQESPEFVEIAEDSFSVSGKFNLDDLNDELDTQFDSEEFDTVGGFVFGVFGRQPKVGEAILVENIEFVVTESDGRRIVRLNVRKLEVEPNDADQVGS